MTDDERLLEIATRLMAGALGSDSTIGDAAYYILKAEQLLDAWRERTGARGRDGEREVSDEMLQSAIDACDVASLATGAVPYWEQQRDGLLSVQRARAAGKGEGS